MQALQRIHTGCLWQRPADYCVKHKLCQAARVIVYTQFGQSSIPSSGILLCWTSDNHHACQTTQWHVAFVILGEPHLSLPAIQEALPDGLKAVNQGPQVSKSAANVISAAIQQLGGPSRFGPDPWAPVRTGVMRPKPHTAHNAQVVALQKVQRDNGKLSLSLFKRVKQLGSGDVGLVDLVQLQVAQTRSVCEPACTAFSSQHALPSPVGYHV